MKEITIKPLASELVNDYLYFFDNMKFTEYPDWKKCYCYSFHFTGPDELWEKERNREAVIRLIREGKMKGYLAYSGKTVVGWCNANDRDQYQRLSEIYTLDKNIEGKICSIVCFLIQPEFRRKGITKMLLQQVIKDYSIKNYHSIEAYPQKGDSSCEKNYKGPLSLYERYNFDIKNEFEHYLVVQKELKPR